MDKPNQTFHSILVFHLTQAELLEVLNTRLDEIHSSQVSNHRDRTKIHFFLQGKLHNQLGTTLQIGLRNDDFNNTEIEYVTYRNEM